jgi:hypothetical protein
LLKLLGNPKARFVLAVSLLIVLAAAGAWLARSHRTEPRFQGKTVTEWFEQCAQSAQPDGTIQDTTAFKAVLRFGQQSVPCLAAAFCQRKGTVAEDWNRIRDRLPSVATNMIPRQLEVHEAWQRTWTAHEIIAASSPEVKSAISRATIPSLLKEIRNERVEDRSYRLSFLQVLEPEPELVVGDLNRFLTDPDPLLRQTACAFLRRYGRAAQPAISNLLRILTNTEPNTVYARQFAIQTLGEIGPEARMSVPILLSFLNHSQTNLCSAATNALQRIARETLTKAGVQ